MTYVDEESAQDLNEAETSIDQTSNTDFESSGELHPTGRVVGIIRRNWRLYPLH